MSGRDLAGLGLLATAFLAWHVPLMFRAPAGQDEDWYGAAGLAILRTGLPHTPYITSDDPSSVCYHADVALYTLPPLSFYLQALAHLVLGGGLGVARLASAVEGLGAVALVYALGVLWFDDRRGALLGATVYTFSRFFLFPATMARPDMAATAFGLLAVWNVARFERDGRRRWLAAAGASAGLALLSHPFGVVPVAQVGLRALWLPGRASWRPANALVVAAAALGAFGLWLPLIALHPDLFRSQFGGNVLGSAGPGVLGSLAEPLRSLGFRAWRLWEFLMPAQAVLFVLGLTWSLLLARSTPGRREFCFHLWASLILLTVVEGQHPTLGYYAYPAALASLGVGMLASEAAAWVEGRPLWRRVPRGRAVATGLALAVLVAALLPGAGLRALVANLRHWNDPDYDVRAFTRAVMADVPAGAVTAVDPAYVLDFHLAGRRVVDAFIEFDPRVHTYDVRDKSFDFAVFGPLGLKRDRPRMDDLALLRTYGDPRDPFACYAELYRRLPGFRPSRPYSSTPR
jgi:4-amino-4-deoxy-L-arabinose transferase-like glycosyltransferase